MPPRRRAGADHLSDEQLAELTTALAEDRRATVYLIEGIPSLGIEPGASAKVIAVDGRTVMVRPKGVNDELPFEFDELRMTRPAAAPRTRPAEAAPAAPRPVAKSAPAPKPAASTSPAAKPAASTSPAAKPAASTSPAAKPATKETAVSTPPSQSVEPTSKPKPAARRPKKQPGVSITITIDPDTEWTVAVAHGTRRVGKPTPVGPDAVERAVRELGDESALEAVQSVIDEARQAAEERVAQLSAQLEEAKKALESLGATGGQIG
ncbi:DUF6319 family protein [Rhodococcus zopfii]|uniref:DUF6319 family protein n=1 Tax=Rhodococcus zopfii TaxID=43772 RepID=UPI0011112754|nr:DUF6319 family protein [Rhodococcus zopfii]